MRRCPPVDQRRIAGAAVDLALTQNGLQSEVSSAREALRTGRFGDSAEREAVRVLAERLDEAYFAAEDAGDDATSSREFHRARAASALFAALDHDPRVATQSAIFEALHSLHDESLHFAPETRATRHTESDRRWRAYSME